MFLEAALNHKVADRPFNARSYAFVHALLSPRFGFALNGGSPTLLFGVAFIYSIAGCTMSIRHEN